MKAPLLLTALALTACTAARPTPLPQQQPLFEVPMQTPDRRGLDKRAFIDLDADLNHRCGVRVDGRVLCWGDNAQGRVGQDPKGNHKGRIDVVMSPLPVKGVEGAVQVALGSSYSCALRKDGLVLCWGSLLGSKRDRLLSRGQWTLGRANPIYGLPDTRAIASGARHLCALDSEGTVRCVGDNSHGQRGIPRPVQGPLSKFKPSEIPSPTDPSIVPNIPPTAAIAATRKGACALTRVGKIYCWGEGVGHGGVWKAPFIDKATRITASHDEACALIDGGRVLRCWETARPDKRTDHPLDGHRITALDSSLALHCALNEVGRATCFETRWASQSKNPRADWIEPWTTLTGALAISPGHTNQCASFKTGALRCWGANDRGQLAIGGLPTQTGAHHPLPIDAAILECPEGTSPQRDTGPVQSCVIAAGPDKGLQDGPWLYFADNGQLQIRAQYDTGHLHGRWTSWHADGRLAADGIYEQGQRQGNWLYTTKEGEEMRGAFEDDQPHGPWSLGVATGGAFDLSGVFDRGTQTHWIWRNPYYKVSLLTQPSGQLERRLEVIHKGITLRTSGPMPPNLKRFFPQPRRIPSQIQSVAPPNAHALTSKLDLHGLAGILPPGCHGPIKISDKRERTLYEGVCDKGRLHGIVRTSAPEGRLIKESHFREGRRHGLTTTWGADGKRIARIEYKHGLEDGQATLWHPTGRVAVRGHKIQGERHGLWRMWAPSGRLQYTGTYHRGDPIGRHQTWYPRGARRSDITFKSIAQVRACFRRHNEAMENHLLDGQPIYIGNLIGHSVQPTQHTCLHELGQRSGPWTTWYPDGQIATRGKGTQETRRFAPETRHILPGDLWGTFEVTPADNKPPLPRDTASQLARRIFASLSPLSRKASTCSSEKDAGAEQHGPHLMRLEVTFTKESARPRVIFTTRLSPNIASQACLAPLQRVAGHRIRLRPPPVGYTFSFEVGFALR